MTILIAIFIALQCCWTWAYRGGSDGFGIPDLPYGNRLLDVLLTPLAIFGALAIVHTPVGWQEWAAWALGIALFAGASADGWGRQMDMTSAGHDDNETGHKIRDLFFKAKSGFLRDLVGLFMRFAQYLAAAAVAFFWLPPAACLIVSFFVAAPLLWVVERLWFRGPGKPSFRLPWLKDDQYMAWVEWFVGVYLAVATVAVVLFAA